MKEKISNYFTVVAELDDDQSYLFPPQLAVPDLRPDVVMFNQLQKAAFILELTICSEVSYAAARERKIAKYMELVSEVEKYGFNIELITLEVDSRGLVRVDGFKRLHDSVFGVNKDESSSYRTLQSQTSKDHIKYGPAGTTLLDINFSTLHG